jgi:membrane fusion protein (multidrug efflux system)
MLDKPREQQQDDDRTKTEPAAPRRGERRQRDQPATPGQEQQSDEQGQEDQKPEGAQKSKSGGIIATIKAHPWITGFVLLALAIAALGGVFFWMYQSQFESTDDAFIDTRIVMISPEVVGDITDVPVTDNQVVHAGDLLARIDPRNYQAAVAQADAQIAQAEAAIETSKAQEAAQRAQVQQAENQITVAQAQLNFSRDENARYQQEVQTGAGTVQRAQQAASDLEAKRAALFAAQDTKAAAARQIAVILAQQKSAEAQREAAEAQRATAEANLSRTELHAPVDGRVTRLTGAVGQLATQGAALMVLVPLDIWVTANYKETQLYDIRVGQPVDIEVDAYGRSFPGRVNSVQAGSGTAFSLLPAENATGNYVKVVQRIPVKLTFDKPPEVELGPGMSVVPSVRVKPPCTLCRMWDDLWKNRTPG